MCVTELRRTIEGTESRFLKLELSRELHLLLHSKITANIGHTVGLYLERGRRF